MKKNNAPCRPPQPQACHLGHGPPRKTVGVRSGFQSYPWNTMTSLHGSRLSILHEVEMLPLKRVVFLQLQQIL